MDAAPYLSARSDAYYSFFLQYGGNLQGLSAGTTPVVTNSSLINTGIDLTVNVNLPGFSTKAYDSYPTTGSVEPSAMLNIITTGNSTHGSKNISGTGITIVNRTNASDSGSLSFNVTWVY
jgi:hypothetical protein